MNSIVSSQPKLFIGIDVHKKSWSVHIRTDISEHKTYTMAPIASALGDYVNRLFSDYEVHVCYEASCCGFTAARYFLSLGWKVTVVNPADIPTTDKHNYQKTDSIDCRNLCKQLQKNSSKPCISPQKNKSNCVACSDNDTICPSC